MTEYIKDISITEPSKDSLAITVKSDQSEWHFYFNVLEHIEPFLDELIAKAIRVREEVRARDAELHVHPTTEQKCPSCDGTGVVEVAAVNHTCDLCDGTGISNRSRSG